MTDEQKQRSNERRRDIYRKRKQDGICVTCGKEKAVNGLKCEGCKKKYSIARSEYSFKHPEKMRKYRMNRVNKCIENGLCIACGKPKQDNRLKCNECSEKMNIGNRQTYKSMVAMGLCRCGNRIYTGLTLCEECRAKNNESKRRRYESLEAEEKELVLAIGRDYKHKRYAERKEKGVCVDCQKELCSSSSIYCVDCYSKLIKRRNNNRKHGIDRSQYASYGMCYICGKPTLEGKSVCKNHYDMCMENLEIANNSEKMIENRKKIKEEHSRYVEMQVALMEMKQNKWHTKD